MREDTCFVVCGEGQSLELIEAVEHQESNPSYQVVLWFETPDGFKLKTVHILSIVVSRLVKINFLVKQ